MLGRVLVVVLSLVTPSVVTGYDERPMNEDEFFGARMQQHNQGQGLYQEPQGRGGLALILAAIAGAGIEWFWTGRTIKRDAQRFSEFSTEFMAKWNADRDALMTRRTYPIKLLAHEVEEADMQLMQLVAAAEDAGVDVATLGTGGVGTARPAVRTAHQDSLEYEEFRQPDANGDNVISKQEFNQYIRAYLQMYPETLDRDIPRFEDFDLNRDGMVTFDEWQLYLDRHQQAEVKHESDLLRSMLETSAQSQGFNSLAQNMQRAQRAGRY